MCDTKGLAKGVGEEVGEGEEAATEVMEGSWPRKSMRGPRLIQRREMGTALKPQEDDLKNPSLQTLGELRSLLSLDLPITAMNLVVYLRALISVLCLGRLGPLALAGGVPSGLEPLCSQFFSSKNWDLDVGSLQSELKQILMLVVLGIVDDDDDVEMKNLF